LEIKATDVRPAAIRTVLNEKNEINVTIQKILKNIVMGLYANRLGKN
jgi:hypothetical protein